MPKPTCSIPACEMISNRAGLCNTHYFHALRDGDRGNWTPCRWPDCETGARARGLCDMHYKRATNRGDFESPWVLEAEEAARLAAERVCKWPGCDSASRVHKWKLCSNHYARAARYGDFDTPWATYEAMHEKGSCKWPECESPVKTAGYCNRDYQRALKLGNFDDPWVAHEAKIAAAKAPKACKWPGCEREAECAGFCSRDYSRATFLGNQVDPWVEWDTSGTCEVCGKKWSSGRRRDKRICSKVCATNKWRQENPERARAQRMDAVRRRRARLAKVTVEYFTIKDVRMARGDDCYLCGGRINYKLRFPHPMSPSLDHVIPISAGGAHSLENAAMAHMECNNRKGARLIDAAPFDTLFTI